jgi:hypothetical protein
MAKRQVTALVPRDDSPITPKDLENGRLFHEETILNTMTRREAIKVAILGAGSLAAGSASIGETGASNRKFDYDALIIGGGPAGLSAAMTLGRMRRTDLVCDDNRPRNAPSSHLNKFPTRDGIHPADRRKEARKTRKNIEPFISLMALLSWPKKPQA